MRRSGLPVSLVYTHHCGTAAGINNRREGNHWNFKPHHLVLPYNFKWSLAKVKHCIHSLRGCRMQSIWTTWLLNYPVREDGCILFRNKESLQFCQTSALRDLILNQLDENECTAWIMENANCYSCNTVTSSILYCTHPSLFSFLFLHFHLHPLITLPPSCPSPPLL